MKRRQQLPTIIKSKALSHNNITRAIHGIADYSHYKKRFLNHIKTQPADNSTPMSKQSLNKQADIYTSQQIISTPISQASSQNRSTLLNKVELTMPEIESPDLKRTVVSRVMRTERKHPQQDNQRRSTSGNPFRVMLLLQNLGDLRQQHSRHYNERRKIHIWSIRKERLRQFQNSIDPPKHRIFKELAKKNQSEQLSRPSELISNNPAKQKLEPTIVVVQQQSTILKKSERHIVSSPNIALQIVQQQDINPWITLDEHQSNYF